MKSGTGLRLAAWIIAIALVALPVVGVLEGWFAASRWPVRQLEVHATFQHVSAAQIRAAVTPDLGKGFFAINLDQVRDALAKLPWVASVAVSKHWPDRLDITLGEIQPVARWNAGQLLDKDGHVFAVPDPAIANGLPELGGPDDRAADVLAFYRVAQADFAHSALQVAGVALSARGSWSIVLANGGRIVVGDDHPEARLARFVASLPMLLQGHDSGFGYADLRYSNGFAVHWPAPAAAPAATPARGANTMLKKCVPALFQRTESGTCPDSASPNRTLAVLDSRRPIHGPRQQGVFQHPANPPPTAGKA